MSRKFFHDVKKKLDKRNKTEYTLITMKEQLINTWPSMLDQYKQEINKFSFHRTSGIYFLFKDGKLQYIGKAYDIHIRISSHQNNNLVFDDIYYIPIDGLDIYLIERELIKHFRPPLNKTDNPDRIRKPAKAKAQKIKPAKTSEKLPKTSVHELLINTAFLKLMPILNTLTPLEKEIIIKRHGLFDNKIITLQVIADEHKISKERVRQIQAKAERRIKHPTRWRKLI